MNTSAITRILCYGDSNTWGWVPGKMGAERFLPTERWTGLVQAALGESVEIIEEGLGGRGTAYDDPRPEMPLRNGLQTLPLMLETHAPVDIAIVMLGTTDCKELLELSPQQITEGMEKIIKKYNRLNR